MMSVAHLLMLDPILDQVIACSIILFSKSVNITIY